MLSRLTELESLAPKGCALAINRMPNLHASTVDSDLWYDIWGYAVAIQGMCVRHGREGSLISAGQYLLFPLCILPCDYFLTVNKAIMKILLCGCSSTMAGKQLC